MKGIGTIFRREIRAYFDSPIAYIFIIVFLLVSTALFLLLPPFFAFPRAEMTGFFGWLVLVLCIFVPAATMGIWADDRKENTIEMLLTFPIKSSALVLGKFFAAFAFYAVTIACTWVLPLMLGVLGDPDGGAILSGYIGAMLLGCLFIAMGTMISGFCRDQVISFVLTFLACAFASLVGWDPFVSILDGTASGLGTMLRNLVGMTGHYLPFTRGVIELVDVTYFILWSAVFLFLNGTYLDGRNRPGMRAIFSTTVLICVAIGAVFNVLISDLSIKRFDLTEGRVYTISDSSKQILSKLEVPVQIKVYITRPDKMPTELKSLQRNIVAKLDEMKVASGGKLEWKVIPMEAIEALKEPGGDGNEKEKSLEARLLDKGVRPFSVRTMRQDQTTTQLIYSSVGVAYKEKEEEIIPQIMPSTLHSLEYRLMNTIYKLIREKPPVVALVAPVENVDVPPQLMQMYAQRGIAPPRTEDRYEIVQRLLEYEGYNVRRVKLTAGEPLPDEYDALFIVDPRNFNERQKWEIGRAIVEGKPTFMAVQNYRWQYALQRNTISVNKRNETPAVNDLLTAFGIEFDTNILMDENHQPVTISNPSNPLQMLFGGGITVDLPTHILINPSSMNKDVSITNRLGPVFYLWGGAVKIDDEKIKENKLEVTTLMSTSPTAWTLPSSARLTETERVPPADSKQMPLAVLVKGQFPDKYAGEKRPEWPKTPPAPGQPPEPKAKEESEPEPVDAKPGKVIFVGCAEMFTKSFMAQSNLEFFINCVDTLTLGDELIHIRSNKPVDRTIDRPSAATRSLWKFFSFASMNLVVAAAGLFRAFLLRRARQNYYLERN